MGGCPDVEFRETISLHLQSGFLTEMPVVRGQACSTRLRLCDDAAPFHCADQCVRVERPCNGHRACAEVFAPF